MFAVQFARAAGARVIVTSSSDAKLARALDVGATDSINYKSHPDWDKEVERLTQGLGVDHVIEIGGAGTLARSYRALGYGGKIALIGFLAPPSGDADPFPLMMKAGSLHGIGVGSTTMFESMNVAVTVNKINPVIDHVFPFDDAREAFRRLASREFVGKIVIRL